MSGITNSLTNQISAMLCRNKIKYETLLTTQGFKKLIAAGCYRFYFVADFI